MAEIRHIITVPLAMLSLVSVFYSIGALMVFLSSPNQIQIQYVVLSKLLDDWSRFETALLPITIDAILIILFILVHSLFILVLRSSIVKSFWSKLGLASSERCIYNLSTAATILFLVNKWQSIPTVALWNISLEKNSPLYWAYVGIHAILWIIIYGGSVIMDFPELTGVKQVYYDLNKLSSPIKYKSQDLIRLYEHIRHPSFIGFTAILWLPNVMSLDRLLLASLWTIYMYIGWSTDSRDVAYQREQLRRKKYELSHLLK